MSHSIYDITEFNVQLDRERLDAMLDRARALGHLEGFGAEGDDPKVEAVEDVLSDFFSTGFELDQTLCLNWGGFEWYDGASFSEDDLCDILAFGAVPGSSLTFLDFDDYHRDIYEVVFHGEGESQTIYHVRDGAPVRRSA